MSVRTALGPNQARFKKSTACQNPGYSRRELPARGAFAPQVGGRARECFRASPMAELHIVAAVRTIDIFPLHASSAEGALVTAARNPIKAERRQHYHQQSDDRV